SAELAIADSGLMVLTWRLLRREKIQRISGLKYLKQLLAKLKREENPRVFWILPSERARHKLLDYSRREAFPVKIEDCYVAPRYGSEVEDRNLLALVEARRPRSEEHTSELQSRFDLVCRLLLEKKKH